MTGVRWVPRQAIVLFLAAAIVLSVPAEAAIGQDAPTSNYGHTSTLTWQHTVGTGSCRLLLVGIFMDTPSRPAAAGSSCSTPSR